MNVKDVIVVCEGGVVQGVISGDPTIRTVIVDWDEFEPRRRASQCGWVEVAGEMKEMCAELREQYELAIEEWEKRSRTKDESVDGP
jgi:hypothetical protein